MEYLTTDELSALKELLVRCTQGQWTASGVRGRLGGQPFLSIDGHKGGVAYVPYSDRTNADHIEAHADQRLISTARNHLPALISEMEARRKNDAITADLLMALKAMTPRAGHPVECMEPNPTEEWSEKGSWNADRCECGIKQAKLAIQKAEEAGL